jgi:hypothetical protein
MFESRDSLLLTGTSHPADVLPVGPRVFPGVGLPRRVSGGAGSFGPVAFQYRRAVRRADETVVVEVDLALADAELLGLHESVARHGTAQLALGTTICRARAVGFEPEARCLVFELHRHGRREAPVSHERALSASAANDTARARVAALSWGAGPER